MLNIKPFILVICFFSSSSFAVDQPQTPIDKKSKTISYLKSSAPSNSIKKELMKAAPIDVISQNASLILMDENSSQQQRAQRHDDHSIYDITTDLIRDDDEDGFYHYFSVTIDADTELSHSFVYADIYLSYEGGPWVYYATTDAYEINYDRYSDAFVVETELADGYPTGFYDLRVKLYDADTDEYLLTYDSYNDYSLSAIPLEDSNRDVYYGKLVTEVIVSHGGGSIGFIIFGLVLLLINKKLTKAKTVINEFS